MQLPQNWSRYVTDDGKEYFHNAVTNITQWDPPPSETPSDVFQYHPTDLDFTSATKAAKVGIPSDDEPVSLHSAPSGRIDQPGPATAAGGGNELFGGLSGVIGSVAGAALGISADRSGSGASEASANGGFGNWLLRSAQPLFDVTTEDVAQRLRLVLIPTLAANEALQEDLHSRPDFYGPFWVATTAVLFLAATGNFARLLQAEERAFKPDYSLVSLAAFTIYGCLLGLPVIVRGSLFFSGEEVSTVNFPRLVCFCGYSLAPIIPVSLLCVLPLSLFRWVFVLAGLAVSLRFVHQHYVRDLADNEVKSKWLKYTLQLGPCIPPVVIFFTYRLRFFSSMSA